MAVKEDRHGGEAEITVDTPVPQPVEPPPEVLLQTAIETNQVAIPLEQIQGQASVISSLGTSILGSTQQQLCTVIAPSTLSGGYTFPAQVDGIDFVVTVPEGGVVEGHAFSVPYPSTSIRRGESDGPIDPLSIEPTTSGGVLMSPGEEVKGRWRNELCECCEVCSNCMCMQGFFCTAILLAQVMTRLHLNLLGVHSPQRYRATFWWIFSIWIALVLLCGFFFVDDGPGTAVGVFLIGTFFFVVTTNLRSVVRRRYEIPPECCASCDGLLDDFCCSFWCWPCTTIQMARHTHDTYSYPYHCCTTTGLSMDAPIVVV